jgi:hypothetical protein
MISSIFIEGHDECDKSFRMDFPHVGVQVDYDDEKDRAEVEAAVQTLKEIVEKHWNEKLFKKYLRSELMKTWNQNDYDLQDDYEDLKDYLDQNGL